MKADMTSPRPLDKDLYALRHRAQELSKGITRAMRGLTVQNSDWNTVLNECSVISSQLINIQSDMEKNVGAQLSKFTLQPMHSHFNCESIGIKKMPHLVQDANRYFADNNNEFIRKYDGDELADRLNAYNRMLSKIDLFNAIYSAGTRSKEDKQEAEGDEDGDEKMSLDQTEKMKRTMDRYLVEYMFCGQTPEQRARMASEEPSDDEFGQ